MREEINDLHHLERASSKNNFLHYREQTIYTVKDMHMLLI